jgi:hypothetical protein
MGYELPGGLLSIRSFEGATVQIAAQVSIAHNPGATATELRIEPPSGRLFEKGAARATDHAPHLLRLLY